MVQASTFFFKALKSRVAWRIAALAAVLFLALFNLTNYPTPWFDEGSHLHVPKTLLNLGQYADYSSDGFRYYGPTIGVGPTVLLPIAAVFSVAGMGLLAARLVIVVYLLGTILCFFGLVRALGNERLAWVATALLIASRGVALLEYGREVLGEVPGFFFIVAGLWIWFSAWERPSWRRLLAVGVCLGLAVITKSQYFIVLAPALALGWLLNLGYYRGVPQRTFLVPGVTLGVLFVAWQVIVLAFLGPGSLSANLALYREATASAATVFSPALMARGLRELLSLNVYLGWLVPVLAYGVVLALPRNREGQRWGLLMLIIGCNLVWYVVASVSWVRYAFVGLALSSVFVARFFYALTDGFEFDLKALWSGWRTNAANWPAAALKVALAGWCAVMILVPLAQSAKPIVRPPANAPVAMAAYMNANVPRDAVVETWEPEMGFLTDHNYHFPPQGLLYRAVSYVWIGGPSPAEAYTFVQDQKPAYVLVGAFARYAGLYPPEWLTDYQTVTQIGGFELYRHK
jgi:4-amino-4-deoxy-L-arabinose transferase-like glycosyltransferase